MSTTDNNKSAGGLISDALSHLSSLVRNEFDLARAEVSENVDRAVLAVGLILGAVAIAIASLNVLSAAVVAGLTNVGIPAGWSAMIVGVFLAIVAFVMLRKGTADLKLSSFAPTRTAKNVKRDAQAVKEAYDAK